MVEDRSDREKGHLRIREVQLLKEGGARASLLPPRSVRSPYDLRSSLRSLRTVLPRSVQ